jgi:hypothetical protein
MKKALVLGVLSLLVAGQASATVMDTWSKLSLQFTNLGRAEASDTGVGISTITTTTGGHLETIAFPFNPGLSLNTVLPVTDPIVSAGGIVEVRLTSVRGRPDLQGGTLGNISGAVASTGVLMPNTIPASGSVRICLVSTGCTGPALPLDVGGTSAGMQIGGGVGGLLTIGGTGTIMISVIGAPYTVKTITNFNRTDGKGIETFMENGFAHGPSSGTTSTGLTSGVIQFVTANHTKTLGVPGNGDRSGNFSRLLIHFVPEPGLLLLLGSGAVGMALLGRKRVRK